ncbi:MAG: hypothetical protein PVJ28_01080 [Acidimicrobiia bacterium]|jgi:hypothetical protein
MSIYDGVVTLADDDIPVIVELDEERVRLSASGTEIGEWRTDECRISHVADSMYTISAENETLHFVPNQPSLFAAAVNGAAHQPPPAPSEPEVEPEMHTEPEVPLPGEPGAQTEPLAPSGDGVREAPPPRPVTMGLFYTLCLLTAGLAVWSLISIIF